MFALMMIWDGFSAGYVDGGNGVVKIGCFWAGSWLGHIKSDFMGSVGIKGECRIRQSAHVILTVFVTALELHV